MDVADRDGESGPKFGTSPNEQYPITGRGRQNEKDVLFAPVAATANALSRAVKSPVLKKSAADAPKSASYPEPSNDEYTSAK